MADAVRRLYVEKKGGFDVEAGAMLAELRDIIRIRGLRKLRLLNRYDVQGLDGEDFGKAVRTIFSEPPIDRVFHETAEFGGSERQIAIECLPGQYDQRADSAAQCAEVMTGGKRPLVRTARIVSLEGDIPPGDIEKARRYLINPIEAREASLGKPETLEAEFPPPPDVETVAGFAGMGDEALAALHARMKYAMAQEDLRFCRDYFRDAERRDPSATELKLIDTYWSDHCRHSTFLTEIGHAGFEPGCDSDAIEGAYREYLAVKAELGAGGGGKAGGGSGGAAGEAKSGGGGSSGGAEMGGGADTGGQTGGGAGGSGESGEGGAAAACLMDIATLAAKKLRRDGRLPALDASDENNACSIEVDADVAGEKQRWLVMFKNETHNHPTEIEPFGGAATCLGGAIRDPLSGRAYVYQAMRLTGSGDPREPVENTLPGKLPQRKITTSAAAGYSSYGNQIGIPTGYVREVYHPGYVAKRMEIGAVIGAAPKSHVRRGSPKPGDAIVLLGGRTGRDGIGGATGSSKEHTGASLLECGSEVQKGNPPAERKLLRFFRNPEAASMIIRCNDFGAGGVAVAIGELADGLLIDLDAVPKKYEGLDGTELAVSESQERMAVAVAGADAARFIELAGEENLEATVVAEVNDSGRVRMTWRGATIVDIARAFLDTNGVRQRTDVFVAAPDAGALAELLRGAPRGMETMDLAGQWLAALSDLNVCSQIGLASRFDSTVGANTVLMPFGGSRQLTPVEGMAAKLPVPGGDTSTATLMACGYDPSLSEASPFHGAVCAVLESLAKIAALGGDAGGAHLTLQEYFPKPGKSPRRWGLPFSAVLGAFYAQMRLSVAAIGGKDSMSGSFNELDVPPALVSFAVAVADAGRVISPEFKRAGSAVALLSLWGGGAGAAGASGAGCAGVAGAIGKGGASGAGAESGGAAGAKAGGADGCACERAGGEGGGSAGNEGGGGADAGAESGDGASGDGASGAGCAGAAGEGGKGGASGVDAGAESGGFLPDLAGYMAAYRELCGAIGDGKVISAYPVRAGGVAAAVSLMCFGNGIGFEFDAGFDRQRLFARDYGAIVLELAGGAGANADEILPGAGLIRVGRTAEAPRIVFGPHMDMPLDEAVAAWSAPLGDIFPERSRGAGESGEPGVQSGESGEPGESGAQSGKFGEPCEFSEQSGKSGGPAGPGAGALAALLGGGASEPNPQAQPPQPRGGGPLGRSQPAPPAPLPMPLASQPMPLASQPAPSASQPMPPVPLPMPPASQPESAGGHPPQPERASATPGRRARPRALIVTMPGNNCEYESAYAFERAGALAEIFVVRNLTSLDISRTVAELAAGIAGSNIVMLPGGFSAGDEPDGSAKFTAMFFRNERVREAVTEFLAARDGLMLGICNGFQALVKLGLLPFGRIADPEEGSPTLAVNRIGRYVSRAVRVAVCKNSSPWLSFAREGDIYTFPVAHGEGRFYADGACLERLRANGQLATLYVGPDGLPTMDEPHNPNGSAWAIEGLTSPDGRVFGKMGHIERTGKDLLKNIGGDMGFDAFGAGVRYFRD